MMRKTFVVAAALAAVLSVQTAGSESGASTPSPSAPTGLHFVKSGDAYLQVASDTSSNATGYRAYASTDSRKLNFANPDPSVTAKLYSSAVVSTPLMTVYGLPHTDQPYYWRVEALNASHRSYSAQVGKAGLRPAPVTSLTATASSAGTMLTWQATEGTNFTIAQATDSTMDENRVDYTIINTGDNAPGDTTRRFTPYGLTPGTTYYFNVQAVNIKSPSSWATRVSAAPLVSEQTLRVDTYNLLKLTSDNTMNDNAAGVIAPWADRAPKAAAVVQSSKPDVVAVQEGGYYTDYPNSTTHSIRQVDSLVSLLPGYVVAPTEVPNPPGYGQIHQTYIVYNSAVLSQVTDSHGACLCGVFELDDPVARRAVYSVLQNKTTGARFLFVSVHLANPNNSGDVRADEAQSMLDQTTAYNAAHGNLPVVYAGDLNANRLADDSPGAVLKPTLNETEPAAQTRYRPTYDSYNHYSRTPPQGGVWVDRVFVTPGVGVKGWGPALQLTSAGQFSGAIPSDHNPIYAAVTIPYTP